MRSRFDFKVPKLGGSVYNQKNFHSLFDLLSVCTLKSSFSQIFPWMKQLKMSYVSVLLIERNGTNIDRQYRKISKNIALLRKAERFVPLEFLRKIYRNP